MDKTEISRKEERFYFPKGRPERPLVQLTRETITAIIGTLPGRPGKR